MSDQIVEPHGSLRIESEKHGVKAGLNLYFVFDGDWAAQYDDETSTEAEAYVRFIDEISAALEEAKNAARKSESPTFGQASTEDRGAR